MEPTTDLVLVVGMWGGGTSAAAAVVDALGVPMGEHLHRTKDPRTPESYEDQKLRSTGHFCVSMPDMEVLRPPVTTRDRLRSWWIQATIENPEAPARGAKWPGLAAVIWELREAIAPAKLRTIGVTRSFDDVLATATRRGWPGFKNPEALEIGWSRAMRAAEASDFVISYNDLVGSPEEAVGLIGSWLGYGLGDPEEAVRRIKR